MMIQQQLTKEKSVRKERENRLTGDEAMLQEAMAKVRAVRCGGGGTAVGHCKQWQ